MMENKRPVRCSENEEIALYLWRKRQEMAERNGISENLDSTLSNAYRNICSTKTPIKSLKDLSQIKAMASGSSYMKKQELIDAAEASGLSRTAIAPDKGKGKPGQFGSSPRDWYTGWSCMKTLISKGLVVKSSCPAK